MYLRVRDPDTGHHFDVPEGSPLLRDGLVVPVTRYEPSPVARPPKHSTGPKRPRKTPEKEQ